MAAADEHQQPHAPWRTLSPFLFSVLGITLFTAPLLTFSRTVATSLVPIAYLIPVIFAATRWGVWPAMVASIAAMAAADFFFFAPVYSFRVDDPQEAVDLLLFLIVSLVSSNLASRLRQETERLRRSEREMQALYEFSRRLASCFTIADLIAAIQQHFAQAFGHPATFFVTMSDGHVEPANSGFAPPTVQSDAAAMNAGIGPMSRTIVDENRRELWLLRAIASDDTIHGVIAVNIGVGPQPAIATRTRRIEAILEETALTLQRLDIGKAMERARLHLQGQLLRDAFHGTLSHELCSPLAAIQGSASVLDSIPAIRADGRIRALVDAISEETAQLDGYIRNLLSATRVTAGGLSPRLEWADPRDIVNGAVKRRGRRLAAHRIEMAFADELPLLYVDSGLIEEACGQILENAAKYSPSGTTISVDVRPEPERVIIRVSDQGVGIMPDEQGKLGRRSFRGSRHQASVPGSGLGFWIATTFVHTHGGTISVQSRGHGQGTAVTIALPATAPEPMAFNE
ncbi:K+-sensing histidine kinase KdpD [Bradyrhizobium sp. USDA 4472]